MAEKKGRLVVTFAALFAALVLTIAAIAPRTARAAGGDVAQIGEQTYATLKDAFNAVPTDNTPTTITLIGDATIDSIQTIGSTKSVVLELDGHILTASKWVNLQGSLAIRDSSQSGPGSIVGSGTNVILVNGGSFTLQSGVISTSKTTAITVQRGSFLMQGGSVSGKKPVTLTSNAASATIMAGTVTSEKGDGIAIEMTGTSALTVGAAGTYDTPVIRGNIKPAATSTLNLLGGIIDGVEGAVPASSTFGSHFTNAVANLPEGFECVKKGDYWVVQPTLTDENAAAKVVNGEKTTLYANAQDAAAALGDGDTLMLLADVDSQLNVKSSGSVTIDLNGHSVNSSEDHAINVTQSSTGTVTIKNGPQTSSTLSSSAAALFVSAQDPATVTLDFEGANINMPSGAAGIQLGSNARVPAEDAALLGNGTFQASVDGTPYAYGLLSSAAGDADEGTPIVLLADYRGTEPMEIVEPGTFVIDLNGHTYETSAACAARVAFSNVDVTFTNGSIVSTSTSEKATVVGIYLVNSEGNAVEVSNVALTLDNVDLSMEHSGNAGVIVQGLNTKNAVTLDGCTLTVPDDVMGIYFPPADSTLTINDTTITAGTGIGLKGGTLSIGGDTQIHARGANDPEGIPSSGGIVETGAAIYIDGGYVDREVAVNVTGGTFVSEQGSAIQELVNPDRPADTPVSVAVTGGSFSDASMRPYLAGDAAVVACEDGTYDVYPTESEALANGGSYKVVDGRNHLWLFSGSAAAEDFAEEAGSKVERIQHTVTFDDCWENTDNAAVTVAHNEPVARPTEDPTADGWKFLGWYEAADGQYAAEPYDFETPVTADLTLYAKWERVSDGSGQQPEPEPERRPEQTESAAEKTDGLAKTSDVTFAAPLVASAVTGMVALGVAGALRRRNG